MKKYVIIAVVVVVLLATFFIILNKKEQTSYFVSPEGGLEEKGSEDYKITDDAISIKLAPNNVPVGATDIGTNQKEMNLGLSSPVFLDQTNISAKYTCDGDNINPPLQISGVGEQAKSLVLIMDDPDALTEVWNHWIKFNIPVTTQEIIEGGEPEGISGEGTGGNLEYSGPCPSEAEHSYVFRLYSLDTELALPEGSSREEVEKEMEGHILQTAELVGKYEREIVESP
ncbi:MAG: YbhB/YbcL family Raf kinase inhibitor-like protein [Patescibacteria group bacterium]|nr:YbhB/YbcL family Raf kinase inhibitor-like protein [Patescibacteria group bacterium]